MRKAWLSVVVWGLCSPVLLASAAEDPPLVDHAAPPRPFDQLHVALDVTWASPTARAVEVRETLDLAALDRPLSRVELDAVGMSVRAVRVDGRPARHEHDGRRLMVYLPRTLGAGERATLGMDFGVALATQTDGGGLIRREGAADAALPGLRSPMIYSQGQAELNRRWVICRDFPDDRMTSEVACAVPPGYTAVSNGRLRAKRTSPDGLVTWAWAQDRAHVSYLISLAVGRFDVVDLSGPVTGSLPVEVYVPAGQGEVARAVFAETPRMIEFFARVFDEPYPWDKYAQVVIPDFPGGMENTSATTMAVSYEGGTAGVAGLVSHELAHQWFGDLLTCRTWTHIWLNEGWATYCEALWYEEHARQAGGDARAAYLAQIGNNLNDQAEHNHATAPGDAALASGLYPATDPDWVFGKPDNPYSKGSLVLHMLRTMLGDEAFFGGVRAYLNRHAFSVVETDDFRHALEKSSGRDLGSFFKQWVYRPGIPRLEVDALQTVGSVELVVEQVQPIDEANSAYVFDLPIVLETEGGGQETVVVPLAGARSTVRVPLAGTLRAVRIDPELTVAGARRLRSGPGATDPGSGGS